MFAKHQFIPSLSGPRIPANIRMNVVLPVPKIIILLIPKKENREEHIVEYLRGKFARLELRSNMNNSKKKSIKFSWDRNLA